MKIGKFEFLLEKKIRNKGDDHVRFEWNQIDEHIFVGTNSCCQIHFDQHLLNKGVTANVSMEEERMDNPRGISIFLWLPTKDHAAPTLDKLVVGARAIREIVEQGHKVYIHCKNGHGRGPTMAAAYYISRGMTVADAIAFVEQRRDEAHIEDVQRTRLEEFEKIINER